MSISVLPQGCTCYTTIPCKLHGVTYSPHRIQSTADEQSMPHKYCSYCKTHTHNDAECHCTRPVGWKPSAPAAGPDTQTPSETPRTNAECFSATTERPDSRDYELEVVYSDFAPNKTEIERWRHILRNYAIAVKASKVIAWLDALELRAETAEQQLGVAEREREDWHDMVLESTEAALAAERAHSKARDDEYALCRQLLMARTEDLRDERAAREAAEEDAQRRENDLRYSYQVVCEREAKLRAKLDALEQRVTTRCGMLGRADRKHILGAFDDPL